MNLVSIVGRKGSGKTEVLESLIRMLTQRGYRIGVIKRLANPNLEIDEFGKDTYRYRMQGAETVILAGKKRLARFSNLTEEPPLEELLASFADFNLIFLEGYYYDEIPKIEVRKKESGDPLLTERVQNIFAVCSDKPLGYEPLLCPSFSFDRLDQLASLIEARLFPKETEISR